MHRIVGFRNVLVHEYDDVDPAIVRRIVERHVQDLQQFVVAIRHKLGP